MVRLTEKQMIDREIDRVLSYRSGPYRVGIVAGLKARRDGHCHPAPAHYADRSVRIWSAGFESGMFRDLRTWEERLQDGDA